MDAGFSRIKNFLSYKLAKASFDFGSPDSWLRKKIPAQKELLLLKIGG
jgi:hypothetical protein